MPKISKIKLVLQEQWSETIRRIDTSQDSSGSLLIYLKRHNNGYHTLVTHPLTRKLVTQPDTTYELHHIFPKSVGGPDKNWNLVKVTLREHRLLHNLRVRTYREHVDKLALTFLKQAPHVRKAVELSGSRSAVNLQSCGFQNPDVQKRAASKGRSTMTLKPRRGYFHRLHPQIQAHLNRDVVWNYRPRHGHESIDVSVLAHSCLTLVDLVRRLGLSGAPVGSKGSKLTSKTSGLARVIKQARSHYGGWSYRESVRQVQD